MGTANTAGPSKLGRGGKRDWLVEQLGRSGLRLDRPALAELERRLGEDVSRFVQIATTLVAVYGEGAKLGLEELEPFLGEAGSVPPWELTDAIDTGDVGEAVTRLRRLLGLRLRGLHLQLVQLVAVVGRGQFARRVPARDRRRARPRRPP